MKKDDYTIENFGLTCCYCGETFLPKNKKLYQSIESKRRVHGYKYYCSEKCRLAARGAVSSITTTCKNCGKEITKVINKRNKSGNYFCNSSCAATYNNTHKTKGVRRSKLELWIESKLSEIYPKLEILYCDKTTINSELDIYIPSLKLAFELNGIYHYEPIHGIDKLNRIQNNDANKFQLCVQHGISMCIIDTSSQKYFKESSSIKFLNIITEIINKNL